MENIGLDDGRAEGFSFSLQGDENKFLLNFRWVKVTAYNLIR